MQERSNKAPYRMGTGLAFFLLHLLYRMVRTTILLTQSLQDLLESDRPREARIGLLRPGTIMAGTTTRTTYWVSKGRVQTSGLVELVDVEGRAPLDPGSMKRGAVRQAALDHPHLL